MMAPKNEWVRCVRHGTTNEHGQCDECSLALPSAEDIATGDPQMRPDDITCADTGEACDNEDCQFCCGEYNGHEWDADEGGYCACGAHPND